MNIAGSITVHLGKLKKNSLITERKDESSIFKINILIEKMSVIKKINNSKPNFNPDLKSEDEDYNYYKKVKIAKPDKFYKKRKKFEL